MIFQWVPLVALYPVVPYSDDQMKAYHAMPFILHGKDAFYFFGVKCKKLVETDQHRHETEFESTWIYIIINFII